MSHTVGEGPGSTSVAHTFTCSTWYSLLRVISCVECMDLVVILVFSVQIHQLRSDVNQLKAKLEQQSQEMQV